MVWAWAEFRISGHLGKTSPIIWKILQWLLIRPCSCIIFQILWKFIVSFIESLGSSLPHKFLHGQVLLRHSLSLSTLVSVCLTPLMYIEVFRDPDCCFILWIPRLRDILNDTCYLRFVHLGLVVVGLVCSVGRLVDEKAVALLTTPTLPSCLSGDARFVLTGLSAVLLGLWGQFIPVSWISVHL